MASEPPLFLPQPAEVPGSGMLLVLLLWLSSALAKWSRAIPIAPSLDCVASTQLTWEALLCSHSCSFKWFPALSIERRGKENDPVEIWERTEPNLGVQADIQDLESYVPCCSFVLQRQGQAVPVLLSSTSPHTAPSCHCCLASACAELCMQALLFLPFHAIRCILL